LFGGMGSLFRGHCDASSPGRQCMQTLRLK